jgi:hypothetical protein
MQARLRLSDGLSQPLIDLASERDSTTGGLMSAAQDGKQLLHLVFGGELTSISDTTFKDLSKLDIVGVYPNYATAHAAWKAKAQATVDQAQMRYFVVHLHRLLDPTA